MKNEGLLDNSQTESSEEIINLSSSEDNNDEEDFNFQVIFNKIKFHAKKKIFS